MQLTSLKVNTWYSLTQPKLFQAILSFKYSSHQELHHTNQTILFLQFLLELKKLKQWEQILCFVAG